MTLSCQQFLEHLEELALGSLDEPERTELLQHASECSQCRARLDQLTWVTEQVLVTAPEIEPPAGFEDRVLGHLNANASSHPENLTGGAVAMAGGRGSDHRLRGRGICPRTAGRELVRRFSPSRSLWTHQTKRRVNISTTVLASAPQPHVLITMTNPRPSTESVRCILVSPSGERTDVGSWSYLDIERGAWAVGINPSLLSSTRMEIIDSRGNMVASAAIS